MVKTISLLIFLLSLSGFCGAQYYYFIDENPPVEVNVTVNKSLDSRNEGFGVTWTAKEDIKEFEIFFQREGSQIVSFYSNPDISFDRSADNYSSMLNITVMGRALLTPDNHRWRIGIRCKGKMMYNGRTSNPSDILWSDYIEMAQR
ncbi:MAG: hypothetical protein FWC19_08540 [Treponema sp.]|nr:hypothetical protein [Treponema sp.]